MITIEMPTWMAIVILVGMILILLYFLVSDLLVKWLHKHYQLELKEKEKEKNDESNTNEH